MASPIEKDSDGGPPAEMKDQTSEERENEDNLQREACIADWKAVCEMVENQGGT